jgi:hypothetical protein
MTYMSVSRSIPIRMDRYDEKNSKKKFLQDPTYKTNNTHPKVNKSNVGIKFGK